MEPKSGLKTTELWMTVGGAVVAAIVAVVPVVQQNLAEGSTAYVVLGAIIAIATTVSTYVFGRSKVKTVASLPKPPDPQ
jgi:hypothetical protein